jgi:hypothetical protein
MVMAPAIVGLINNVEPGAHLGRRVAFAQGGVGFTQLGDDLSDGAFDPWPRALLVARPSNTGRIR